MSHRPWIDPDRWRSNRHGLPPGMSPAERIAARVRHRVKESERRALLGRVAAVSSLAEEIDALKAKAAADGERKPIKILSYRELMATPEPD